MAYTRVNWQNSPSHATPLSAENLNVMDEGIKNLDDSMTEATDDISTLETTVSGHTTSISALETTVGEHTADIQNNSDDISDLQTLTSGHTTSIGNLQTAVGTNTEDITDLKEEFKQTNNDIYSITQSKVIPLKPNGYIDLSGSSIPMSGGVPVETGYSQTFSYGLFPCSEGDVFTINGVGGNSTRLWGFVDANGNILSVSSKNAKAKGYSLVAPKNASWIIVHTNEDSVSFYGEPLINKVNALLPNNAIDNASYIHVVDVENLEINLTLESGNNKTIYVTGNNLCDNQAKNVAIAVPNIVTGSDYSGLIVPIKGGEIYTVSRTAKVTNRFRAALTVDYPADGVTIVGTVITADNSLSFVLDTTSHPEAKYVVIYLSNSGESISTADYQVEFGYIKTNYEPYNAQVIVTDETSATVIPRIRNANIWCDTGKISAKYYRKAELYEAQTFSPINTGNISIVCAKEHRYTDGTQAVIEGYLVEECGTKKFFFTKDFANYKYMFTAHIETYKYSFGMLANGDVIACKMAEMLSSAEKSDGNRENPYCWLASENWSIEHEVDFGQGLKPCGWLENCGFKVISNGHALFGEYTRANMATANVWEIVGDPSSRWNWKVRKSFDVTSVDNITGFKHIHMVEQDCYTGIVYVSTGDDNDNSMMWYSTNSGVTWTQLGASNEKYCRNLSITFTKDYVYWVPDTPVPSKRYLFRAVRNSNGIIDMENIDDYIELNSDAAKGIASYGATYIMPYECMLILDRCDGDATEMELTLANLTDGTLHSIAKIESATGSAMHIGFRTRYSEFISRNGVIHFGFGFQDVNVVNHNKGFDNKGYDMTGGGIYNINNILILVNKIGEQFKAIFDTII